MTTRGRSPIRSARARRAVASATALLLLTSAGGHSLAAQGSLSLALDDPPVDEADPRSAYYVVDHVAPGGRIERAIALGNSSDRDVEVALYIGDAEVADGRFAPADGRGTAELAEWTSFEPERVDVARGDETTATLTIDVPDEARPGERYGVAWAELPASGEATRVVNRVGIRVYLSIGDGERPAIEAAATTITATRLDDGGSRLSIALTNNGGRAAELAGRVELTRAGRSEPVVLPLDGAVALAPGEEAALATGPSDDVTDGEWDATVALHVNGVEQLARGTVEVPGELGAEGEPADLTRFERTSASGTGPWPIVAVALVALVLAGTIWAGRRARTS